MANRSIRKTILTAAKWGIGSVAFVGYIFSVALFLRVTTKAPPIAKIIPPALVAPVIPAPPQEKVIKHGTPVTLDIPLININAHITPAGLTPDGAMDVLKGLRDITWYSLGPRPGDIGSAVIAGHYGWVNGEGAIFNNLRTLKPGDLISVTDENGLSTSFTVRETKNYAPSADATAIFRSNDGKAHLNLITCEGVWNAAQQTYSGRLVVFTDIKL